MGLLLVSCQAARGQLALQVRPWVTKRLGMCPLLVYYWWSVRLWLLSVFQSTEVVHLEVIHFSEVSNVLEAYNIQLVLCGLSGLSGSVKGGSIVNEIYMYCGHFGLQCSPPLTLC